MEIKDKSEDTAENNYGRKIFVEIVEAWKLYASMKCENCNQIGGWRIAVNILV